jgi:hypothetical protein
MKPLAGRMCRKKSGTIPSPRSFRPAGRGRRSAAFLPTKKFVIDIIPQRNRFLNAVPKISGNVFLLHFIIGMPAVFLLKSLVCSIARTKTDTGIFQP